MKGSPVVPLEETGEQWVWCPFYGCNQQKMAHPNENRYCAEHRCQRCGSRRYTHVGWLPEWALEYSDLTSRTINVCFDCHLQMVKDTPEALAVA